MYPSWMLLLRERYNPAQYATTALKSHQSKFRTSRRNPRDDFYFLRPVELAK